MSWCTNMYIHVCISDVYNNKNIYDVSVCFILDLFPHILLYHNFCIFVSQPLEEIQGLVQSLCDKVGVGPSVSL